MSLFSDPGLIELAFVYSIALGLGIWQLISIRRTIERRRASNKDKSTTSPDMDGRS